MSTFFKNINDQFGHQAGDAVLKQMAQLCRPLLRANDLIVRWGGEEFLVVVRGCHLTDAVASAERLREKNSKASLG